MNCNATLTTVELTVPHVQPAPLDARREGLVRIDGVWHRIRTVHVITCVRGAHAQGLKHLAGPEDGNVLWTDRALGATPHWDPLVSAKEIDAAMEAWDKFLRGRGGYVEGVTKVLEAAARAREAS